MKNTFGAIILSGGKSERMNYPKAFLEIVVVLNDELAEDKWKEYSGSIDTTCKVVLNHHSEKGKFYSLQLGAKNITSEYCFIQNVDNPFVSSFTLNSLIKSKNPNGITIPMYKGKGGHPILVSKKVIEKISLTENTNQHLKDFYWTFSKKSAEMKDDAVLMNINTLEDYEKHIAVRS